MTKGKHYEQTYAPVARWNSIRLLLSMATLNNWHTTKIDYVSAFPQAPVEREFYMQLPRGFDIADAKPGDYVFRLNKNVYGQKSAGRVWNQYLTNKLTKEVGFTQSKTDDCVFLKEMLCFSYTQTTRSWRAPARRKSNR
jgi:hypothetical protein